MKAVEDTPFAAHGAAGHPTRGCAAPSGSGLCERNAEGYAALVEARSPSAVTELLQAWSRGDVAARDQLFPLVYAELWRRAARYLRRERPAHTLQPTALVHEAYIRLSGRN